MWAGGRGGREAPPSSDRCSVSSQHFPEYAITLSAMAYDHYCCHAEVESDPSEPPRPTLLVEVCSTVQPSTAQGGQLIEAVSDILNPEGTYQ